MTRVAPLDITVVILTFNEGIHIRRCIERIRPHVRRVVVIDSFSTDRTVELAEALGAEVHQHEFANHAAQFNWALDTVAMTTAWTLKLDADEYLDEAALGWLRDRLATLPEAQTAVEFRLKVHFQGGPIMHGGYYSTDLVRLWRTGTARIEERLMDERVITSGERVHADGHLIDENLNPIGWWTAKHNGYATRHAVDLLLLEHAPEHGARTSGQDQARRVRLKRFLRNRVYARTPLFVRPLLYWLYRYFLQLGFLDGRRGLVWHFLHAFWYYMVIDAKLYEARLHIRRHGIADYERRLAEDHGIAISLQGEAGRALPA